MIRAREREKEATLIARDERRTIESKQPFNCESMTKREREGNAAGNQSRRFSRSNEHDDRHTQKSVISAIVVSHQRAKRNCLTPAIRFLVCEKDPSLFLLGKINTDWTTMLHNLHFTQFVQGTMQTGGKEKDSNFATSLRPSNFPTAQTHSESD